MGKVGMVGIAADKSRSITDLQILVPWPCPDYVVGCGL